MKAEGLRAEEKTCSCRQAWRTRPCQTRAWRGAGGPLRLDRRGPPAGCADNRVSSGLSRSPLLCTLVFQVPLSFFFNLYAGSVIIS